ncbi:MAG: undecaprenyldiphospho-muramoylpentapeptide beta-N-acetylglucosaminyltransferase [Thermodesulfobacteriota bacterium]
MDKKKNFKIAITGGGTGGHLYPGVALADVFTEKNSLNEVLFLNTGNSLEKNILNNEGYEYKVIPSGGILGKSFLNKFKNLLTVLKSVSLARTELKKFKADAVIGVGGYVSVPVIIAAIIGNIPVFLQEQNSVPGISNKIFAYFAKLNFTSFPDTKLGPDGKNIFTGNPIRKKIGLNAYKTDKKSATIFITGGSQGAESINKAVCDSLKFFEDLDKMKFIHQTGEKDYEFVKKNFIEKKANFEVQPFFSKITDIYSKSDLIIARAGASTIAELTCAKIPAILVPFPFATHNHQYFNAKSLAGDNAAVLIEEKNLTGEVLAEAVKSLINDKNRLETMSKNMKKAAKPNAADEIYYRIKGKLS